MILASYDKLPHFWGNKHEIERKWVKKRLYEAAIGVASDGRHYAQALEALVAQTMGQPRICESLCGKQTRIPIPDRPCGLLAVVDSSVSHNMGN